RGCSACAAAAPAGVHRIGAWAVLRSSCRSSAGSALKMCCAFASAATAGTGTAAPSARGPGLYMFHPTSGARGTARASLRIPYSPHVLALAARPLTLAAEPPVKPLRAPSESMYPTLSIGAHVEADFGAYDHAPIRRDDIVVYHPRNEKGGDGCAVPVS